MSQVESDASVESAYTPGVVARLLESDRFQGMLHGTHMPVRALGIGVVLGYADSEGLKDYISTRLDPAEDERDLPLSHLLLLRATARIEDIKPPALQQAVEVAAGLAIIGYARFRGFVEDAQDTTAEFAERSLHSMQG